MGDDSQLAETQLEMNHYKGSRSDEPTKAFGNT